MTLKSRVFLIFCGVVVFLAAAPTILFLAQGYGFDWKTGRVIKTGTLVIKTEPRAARVYLNGKQVKDTPLVKRFLPAGEYQIEIKKAGYHPWKKQIRLHEQQVTFLPSQTDKINLLSESAASQMTESVLDFYATQNSSFYLKTDGVYRLTLDGFTAAGVASTTFPLVGGKIVEAREQNNVAEFIIADQKNAWYLSRDKFFVLPSASRYFFGPQPKTVLSIDAKNQLWQIEASGSQKILRARVQAAAVLDEIIYFISTGASSLLGNFNESGRETVVRDLPASLSAAIVVSPLRQIFVLLDGSLYELADDLKKINDNVSYAVWDQGAEALVYGNDFESWVYESLGREPNRLVTRASKPVGTPFYHELLGYTFTADHHTIKAIEADFSGQPNVYILTEIENPNAKISVDESGEVLTYLDGQKLFLLPLR